MSETTFQITVTMRATPNDGTDLRSSYAQQQIRGALLAAAENLQGTGDFDAVSIVGEPAIEENPVPQYAELSWCAEDILSMREGWTVEQAEAFLERNERHLRDRLCELGWDALQTYLEMDDADEQVAQP